MKHKDAKKHENASQEELILVCRLQGNGSYDCKRVDTIPYEVPASTTHTGVVRDTAAVSDIEPGPGNDTGEDITPGDFFTDDDETGFGDADRKTTDQAHPKRKTSKYSKKMGTCPIIPREQSVEDSS